MTNVNIILHFMPTEIIYKTSEWNTKKKSRIVIIMWKMYNFLVSSNSHVKNWFLNIQDEVYFRSISTMLKKVEVGMVRWNKSLNWKLNHLICFSLSWSKDWWRKWTFLFKSMWSKETSTCPHPLHQLGSNWGGVQLSLFLQKCNEKEFYQRKYV